MSTIVVRSTDSPRKQEDENNVSLVIEDRNIDALDEYGQTQLHKAVLAEDPELISVLIKKGASFIVPNKKGYSPLRLAVDEEKIQSIRSLLEAGKLLGKREEIGYKLLIHAISFVIVQPKILDFILKEGLSLELRDECKRTLLMIAIDNNNNDNSIRWLLERGAYTDARDAQLKTPLIHADEIGNEYAKNILQQIKKDRVINNLRTFNKNSDCVLLVCKSLSTHRVD